MTAAPDRAEPQLDDEERRLLAVGVDQFNRGLFFECHDTLEDMWSGLRGPARDFYQGLIQVSVAFYHLGNGNLSGAASMLRRALRRLSHYPARYAGFDLEAHRRELEGWLARVEGGPIGPLTLDDLPKWSFTAPPSGP